MTLKKMIEKINAWKREYLLTTLLAILIIAIVLPIAIAPNVVGGNYKNVTIQTYVNITNAKPEVLNVTVYEAGNASSRNLTINAGSIKTLYCNGTVRDWDGYNDIVNVSGILWFQNTTENASNDNNSRYSNVSCTLNASVSAFVGWYVCAFDVWYYANNGTWNCSINVTDTQNKTGRGLNNTIFYPVYALNVTDGINFGNVAVEDISAEQTANITNLGNMAINITLEGYGTRRNDSLAMNCSLSGNISIGNERFALNSGVGWAGMTPLVSTLGGTPINGLTMPKQTLHNTHVVNATYWQLYIPPNPAGNCTGFIIFSAQAP